MWDLTPPIVSERNPTVPDSQTVLSDVLITNKTHYNTLYHQQEFKANRIWCNICSLLVLHPSLKPISWESVRSAGFYLDFLPEMLESWRPNPSWMDAVASVLLNLRGRQSGQGEKAHSVTALNHDTKLQIPVIHLSQEIQSVALLQPHVFIPRSRLDSGWGVLFWNMAIFVWDLNDTCGHFFFFFFLWFFFFSAPAKELPEGEETHLGIKCARRRIHCTA